jgi:hypothetical protein
MAVDATRDVLEGALAEGNGVLRLEPAWVARDFLPPGRRLGVADDAYDLGERGAICERWLASTTKADNRIGPPDEGLSYVALDGPERVTLKDAVEANPIAILGASYATAHAGLGRLAKLFDYAERLPLHLHQRQEHAALVGRHSKDEAYYFPPGVDMGAHPETFLGVHPGIAESRRYDTLLPYLQDWNSDQILQCSRAYLQVPEEGFHIPSGVLHGPGTALTIELQEDSDVFAMLQARCGRTLISKDLLWKDVRERDREEKGERLILELIDWEENGDPYFYENHRLSPQLIESSRQPDGEEFWIYYNTMKFSGKKLLVRPHGRYQSSEKGVFSVFVWQGAGSYDGIPIEGGVPGMDELLVTDAAARSTAEIRNSGDDDLIVIKFFGPDLNPDVPMIFRVSARGIG